MSWAECFLLMAVGAVPMVALELRTMMRRW
jgi:hypothetical protein